MTGADVLEATGLPILDVDIERRVTYATRAFAELVRREPKDLIGCPGSELIHPKDLSKSAEAFRRRIEGEFVPPYRLRILAADGEVVPVELYASPIRGGSGEIVGIRSIVFDQRPLEDARRKLRQTEARLHGVLEATPDLAYFKDREGRFTWLSSKLLAEMGKRPEEVVGKTPLEAFGPEVAAVVAEDDRQVLTGRMVVSERRMTYEGRSAIVQFFKAPIFSEDGEVTGIACFLRNVTDRYEEQERIRLNEQRYRAVSQLVAGYVLSMKIHPDGSGEVEWLEGDFEKIIGRPPEGFYEGGGFRTIVHPEDRSILYRRRKRIFGGEPSTDEFRIVRPDGQIRWLRAFAGPEKDEQGNVQRVYSAVADITAQKEMEERAKVVSRFESLGQLAAGLGHDISNLLQSLITNLELALGKLEKNAPREEVRAWIEKALSRSDAMRELARSLTQFAADQGSSEECDISAETRRIASLLADAVRRGVELQTQIPKARLPVRMSKGAFQQILTNLVLNASDAMADGGAIQLSARRVKLQHPKKSDLGLTIAPGDYVLLRVSDAGPGIPGAMLPRIFEPFVTTRRDNGHSGLGLATVLRHVAAAGGLVSVENNPSGGATFRVYLPLAQASAPAEHAVVSLPVAVLVVEDDAPNRASIAQALEEAGYYVLTAGSCREAWDIAIRRARPLDCVLTDFSLPDGSGDRLGSDLVSESFALRYALMTSQAAGEPGAPALHKPFTREELLAFVEQQVSLPVDR